MTKRTSKEVIKSLSDFDLGLLKSYLLENDHDEEFIVNLLDKSIVKPEIIKVHNPKDRACRDTFFNSLFDLLEDYNCKRSASFLRNKIMIILSSEAIYDDIGLVLSKCAVEELPLEEQIWSHIKRAEGEYEDIHNKIEELKNKKPKGNLFSHVGGVTLKDENGHEFDPDAVCEKINESLSLIISLLAYRENSYLGSKIVIPDRLEVTEEDTFKAGSTQLFAIAWKALEDVSYRALLFGGHVRICDGEEVPKDARLKGVEKSYHFLREESEIEVFDSISNQRLNRKISQNQFEFLHDPQVEKLIVSSLDKLALGNFLSMEELSTTLALEDVFCTKFSEDKSLFAELTLFEWVRGYSCLQFIGQSLYGTDGKNIISEDKLLSTLVQAGLNDVKASKFIDIVSYGRNSKDLFDCPLILLSSGKYYLFSHTLLHANLAVLIISRMSSLQVKTDKKGYNFEDTTIEKISKHCPNCKGFKFKRKNEEYEYDAVFTLDNYVFVVECKNRSLSGGNPVNIYRKKQFLESTATQVKRLANALTEYPEVFHEHFELNIDDFIVTPVVLSCMPFSWANQYEGVYFTDFSSLSRFFSSSHINAVVSKTVNHSRELENTNIFKMWESEKPSAIDLLRHFENPIQLRDYLITRKKESLWLPAGDAAFTIDRFSNCSKLMRVAQNKSLPSKPVKIISSEVKKKTKRKNKKRTTKEARKKNRRKK